MRMPVTQVSMQPARCHIVSSNLVLLEFPVRLEGVGAVDRIRACLDRLGNHNLSGSRPVAYESSASFVWKCSISFLK